MKLIIFSYPLHFNIAKRCKQLAVKNLPNVTEVIYAWDDIFQSNSTKLLNKLKKTENVVLYSQFLNVADESEGWLRQQFVKLQLHHVFNDECYLILDSDTLIRNTYRLDIDNPRIFVSQEYYSPYFIFIEKCLGLTKTIPYSFVSPLWLFERQVLESLEKYSLERNGCSVIEFYQKNDWSTYDPTPPFSEGEIYGTFATQILGRHYEYIRDEFSIQRNLLQGFRYPNKNLVLHGSDLNISKDDWAKIDKNIGMPL